MRLKIFTVLSTLFFLSACDQASVYTNLGYLDMYKGAPSEAQRDFTKALLENPNHAIARYNLSMSSLQLEQIKDSLKELEALEKLYETSLSPEQQVNSENLYRVYFAKAFVLALIQNVPEALAAYQKALRIHPKSKEVKNNIEVLTMESKGGGKGKSGKDKKAGKDDKGDGDKSGGQSDKEEDKEGKGQDDKTPPKGQDEESLKKKNLSKEEIEQILKEIKDQESKVRAKENKGKAKKGKNSDKTW